MFKLNSMNLNTDVPSDKSQEYAVIMCSVCCYMAQQTPLLTLATLSVGAGLRSVNRKLRSLCGALPGVGPLIFCLPALPAAATIVPPELNGFQPHQFVFLSMCRFKLALL